MGCGAARLHVGVRARTDTRNAPVGPPRPPCWHPGRDAVAAGVQFMSIFGRHAFCIFALIIVPVLAFHVKTALATIARNEMFVNWNDPLLWRVRRP